MKKEIVIRITIEIPDEQKREVDKGFIHKRISEIEWEKYSKCRINHVLSKQGIETIEDLTKWHENQLLRLENMGRKAVNQIKHILHKNNLGLCDKYRDTRWRWNKETKEMEL